MFIKISKTELINAHGLFKINRINNHIHLVSREETHYVASEIIRCKDDGQAVLAFENICHELFMDRSVCDISTFVTSETPTQTN